MDIYVSYTCLKITSVFHITLTVMASTILKLVDDKFFLLI